MDPKDHIEAKKKHLDEMMHFAKGGMAKHLKAKYHKPPMPKPDAAPMAEAPPAPGPLDGIDPAALEELLAHLGGK